ncbi:hypothetical protein J5N97_014546 [Dioscorea zingiberensis]|uniref:Uncharacterized protein n=1 Tax=Dioscorea zingiberensis TaxID=325984 RepID=A0A9D5CU49_9LILI|nr:hypothetical protein J5N97_014546 [Dioscorea zingiberensis]
MILLLLPCLQNPTRSHALDPVCMLSRSPRTKPSRPAAGERHTLRILHPAAPHSHRRGSFLLNFILVISLPPLRPPPPSAASSISSSTPSSPPSPRSPLLYPASASPLPSHSRLPRIDAILRATTNPNDKIGFRYLPGGSISVSYSGVQLAISPWPKVQAEPRQHNGARDGVSRGRVQPTDAMEKALEAELRRGEVPLGMAMTAPVKFFVASLDDVDLHR